MGEIRDLLLRRLAEAQSKMKGNVQCLRQQVNRVAAQLRRRSRQSWAEYRKGLEDELDEAHRNKQASTVQKLCRRLAGT